MVPDTLTSGAPAYRAGRAGLAARSALAGTVEGVARCKAILANANALNAAHAVAAADVLLTASQDPRLGLRAADRQAIVDKLRELVADIRTPDGAAVDAVRLILRATGRKNWSEL